MKTYILKLLSFFLFLFAFYGANAQMMYDNFNETKKNELKEYVDILTVVPKSSATMTITTVSGVQGSNVSVPVNSSDITDLAGFQWTIEYDDTKLTYVDCTNWNSALTGSVTINSSTSGKLTFVYSEATGVNITAGKFFDVNFSIASSATGIANLTWSDDPTARLLNNSTPAEITTTWNDGSVIISGTLSPSLTIEKVNGTAGSAVVVPVNAADITDLVGFQWTIDYDETKLSYVNCTNWDSEVDAAGVVINDDGSKLTFAYNDYPNTITANGKFFDINFNVLAGATGVAPVDWSDDPTQRELSNSVPEEITATWNNGSVTMQGTLSPSLTIEQVPGTAGSPVVVPVDATDLTDLVGFQWTIDYDETKLSYVNCTNWDSEVNSGSVVINDDGSKLTFAYNDYPNTITVNGKFFDLNFNVLAGATGVAPVVWSDDPTQKELSNSVPEEIVATWNDGSVVMGATITIDTVMGTAGSAVVVPVNALNISDLVGFQWTIDYDETRLSYVNCTNWDAGVTASVTINDDGSKLTFAYNDYPNAINITDGKFFDLNFNVLAGATGIAPVVWSDDPTVKELSNSVPEEIIAAWIDGAVILDLAWDGSESTDWQTPANWTPEIIPTIGVNAVIPDGCPNYPVIDDGVTTAFCNNLSISANASVTIASNGQMTVAGILTNLRGVDGLIVKSDASGDGSLIENTLNIDATVERFLPTADASTPEWHFVSTAITSAPTSLYGAGMYDYDETQDDWWTGPTYYFNGAMGWSDVPASMVVAEGYIWNGIQQTKVYQGKLNANSTYTIPVSYTVHAGNAANGDPYTSFDGWVLAGNPFPCSLDWEKLDKSDDITATVYYYDDDIDNYAYYQDGGTAVNGGSQYIPSGQGFFIKTNDQTNGGNLTIPATARTHTSQGFWKKSDNEMLKLKVAFNDYSDETAIVFNENANDNFDDNFDAFKHFSWNPVVPQIFSMSNDRTLKMAINSFYMSDFQKVIPLGLKFSQAGNQTISIEQNSLSGVFVIMHNLHSGDYKLLNDDNFYQFDAGDTLALNQLELILEKNVAPSIVNILPDEVVYEGESFEFSLPDKFYSDANMFDSLTISASLSDGSALPDWLNFDVKSLTFKGLCKTPQILTVRVRVTDYFGATTYDDFIIEVKSVTKITDISEHVISLYPVPAENVLYLNVGGDKVNYNVILTTISGKKVFDGDFDNEQVNSLNISDLSSGVYMMSIHFNDKSVVYKKIMKRP